MTKSIKRFWSSAFEAWHRHRLDRVLIGLCALMLLTIPALAQYNPNMPYPYSPGLFGPSRLPSPDEVIKRFLLDAIAAVLGFIVGAFFSPMLRPYRRTALFIAIGAVTLYAWLGYAPIAQFLTTLVSVFAFFVALGYGLQLGAIAYREAQREAERPISFGSAQWASHDHIHENGLLTGKGFLLGSFIENGNRMPIHYAGPRHLLTVAPTRSGKGVSSIIPNLLTYEGSAFIIDPKGENALVTAHRRGSGDAAGGIPGLGQKIYLLDPWDIASSKLGMTAAHFNPLDWIRADDIDAAENAFLLAEALIPSGAGGESRFWDEESKALLCGIILFVATAESEAGNRHLGRVRDILLLGETGFKAVLETMYKEPNSLVKGLASRTAAKDVKLRSNTMAAAQSHTHFLDSPRIRESLSRSDFGFEDLKTTPMTVYLILPADRLETFGRWLRVLIQQAITINARNISIRPAKPVLFLLDEMAALGRLTMVEQAFGLMAGFGIQLWGIVQDLSQLERIYDKGWQTFISNSGVIQYFGSRDKITAEYFSTLCGVTTIRITNLSYTIGKAFSTTWSTVTGGGGSNSSTQSESSSSSDTIASNESQRQLAYPDELMVLKHHQQIIFVENLDPIRAEKLRWYDDQSLQRLGVNLRSTQIPRQTASETKRSLPSDDLQARRVTPEAGVSAPKPRDARPAAESATIDTPQKMPDGPLDEPRKSPSVLHLPPVVSTSEPTSRDLPPSGMPWANPVIHNYDRRQAPPNDPPAPAAPRVVRKAEIDRLALFVPPSNTLREDFYSDPDFGDITIRVFPDQTAELETIAGSTFYGSLAELLSNIKKMRAELGMGK